MPETCRVLWQNKFWIFDVSSWLFYTKLITMHGHLNIKYTNRTVPQTRYRESTLISWAITDGSVSLNSFFVVTSPHSRLSTETFRIPPWQANNIKYDIKSRSLNTDSIRIRSSGSFWHQDDESVDFITGILCFFWPRCIRNIFYRTSSQLACSYVNI
jgi:hypothetical protein